MHALVALLLLTPQTRPAAVGTQGPIRIVVDLQQPVAQVDEFFLSVAIDIAHVVGARFWTSSGERAPKDEFDLDRPNLKRLSAALAPGYLRIGGTDADRTTYRMEADESQPPRSDEASYVLTRSRWDEVNRFASKAGFRVMFTLNAGKQARDEAGNWRDENARSLIDYTVRKKFPVDIWELGNEVNAFLLLHGQVLTGERYARDVGALRAVMRIVDPHARLAGPAAAFWPLLGEGLPFLNDFLAYGGRKVDVITWHYYPTQSHRCPVSTHPAHAGDVLRGPALSEIDKWADYVEQRQRHFSPHAEIWLGETGSAQCGGEPGFSDRFASSFWWLDQLGRMARRGQAVVIRQALIGGDYALLDEQTLEPRPDYWASVLWRRLMGRKVLRVTAPALGSDTVIYAHCARGSNSGAVTVLIVNSDIRATPPIDVSWLGASARIFRVTAATAQSGVVFLNGRRLSAAADGTFPAFEPMSTDAPGVVVVAPLSYVFAVFPDANAAACH